MIKVLEVNVDDHLYGGVYVLVRNIIRKLPEGITADIAALEPFDDNNHIHELNEYGTRVYYVGSVRNKIVKQIYIFRNVRNLVKKNNYDVIHLHSDVSHKILVSALAARKTKKLIFHSHSNDAEGSHIKLRRIFHKCCCLVLKRIPATYIATSFGAARWMFPWAKDNEVIILENGIDYQRYKYNAQKRNQRRKELAVKENEFLIGFFGRFVTPKNPFYALNIFQAVLKKNPKSRMLCIGDGPLKEEFILRLRKENIYNQVIFIRNTDSIEDYYQAIDALILPSTFEGFGLVAVESQISGTPTFVSVKVPETTKISSLIHFISIEEDAVSEWRDHLLFAKTYVKHDVENELDKRYELNNLVDKLVNIYN